MKLSNVISLALEKPRLVIPHTRGKLSLALSNFTTYALMPKSINLAITNKCNARCVMCDFGQENKDSVNYKIMRSKIQDDSDIDIDLFKKIISDVKNFKPFINLMLVEPLLNKNLMELIKICKHNGLIVEITTNGYLLPLLAEKLVKSGVYGIQVSIDGPPEIHNSLRRVKDSFEKAMEGIRLLDFYKKKYNKKLFIKINYTISNLNSNAIIETLNCLKKVEGINMVKLQTLSFITEKMKNAHNGVLGDYCPITTSSVSDSVNPQKVDVDELYQQIKEVKKRKYPFLIDFIPNIPYTKDEIKQYFYDELKFLKNHTECGAPYKNVYIDIKGDVRPHTRCYDIVMGNIKEEDFKKIWNGKKYRGFRARIRKKAFIGCARCCGVL
ncbi:MAG: radical SAM protein [Nanoarchaeota archaeon]|nr:radical SAM protein [Nanoarchaeota archaeon]